MYVCMDACVSPPVYIHIIYLLIYLCTAYAYTLSFVFLADSPIASVDKTGSGSKTQHLPAGGTLCTMGLGDPAVRPRTPENRKPEHRQMTDTTSRKLKSKPHTSQLEPEHRGCWRLSRCRVKTTRNIRSEQSVGGRKSRTYFGALHRLDPSRITTLLSFLIAGGMGTGTPGPKPYPARSALVSLRGPVRGSLPMCPTRASLSLSLSPSLSLFLSLSAAASRSSSSARQRRRLSPSSPSRNSKPPLKQQANVDICHAFTFAAHSRLKQETSITTLPASRTSWNTVCASLHELTVAGSPSTNRRSQNVHSIRSVTTTRRTPHRSQRAAPDVSRVAQFMLRGAS